LFLSVSGNGLFGIFLIEILGSAVSLDSTVS